MKSDPQVVQLINECSKVNQTILSMELGLCQDLSLCLGDPMTKPDFSHFQSQFTYETKKL